MKIKAPKIPTPKELTLHIQVVKVLQEHCYPYWAWWHTPNGEWRSKAGGAKLKAMGVKPGIPDLILIAPDNTVRFLELKREGEKLSDAQMEFEVFCIKHGHAHAVAYNLKEALEILSEWNCLRVRL